MTTRWVWGLLLLAGGAAQAKSAACGDAVACLAKCDDGDGASCFILGSMYEHGVTVATDVAKASSFYQLACDHKDKRGCEKVKALSGTVQKAQERESRQQAEESQHRDEERRRQDAQAQERDEADRKAKEQQRLQQAEACTAACDDMHHMCRENALGEHQHCMSEAMRDCNSAGDRFCGPEVGWNACGGTTPRGELDQCDRESETCHSRCE